MFIPMLLLGLDAAVRDERLWGGVVAGLALIMSFTSDTHVLFFAALLTPAWCAFAFFARGHFEWKSPRAYWGIARALLPALLRNPAPFLDSTVT